MCGLTVKYVLLKNLKKGGGGGGGGKICSFFFVFFFTWCFSCTHKHTPSNFELHLPEF